MEEEEEEEVKRKQQKKARPYKVCKGRLYFSNVFSLQNTFRNAVQNKKEILEFLGEGLFGLALYTCSNSSLR